MPENENNQVTITFGGYDDTPDNNIMFEGPINVWKTIDDIDNLYLLHPENDFEPGTPVVVFVRNINKKDPTKPLRGEIGYRGSFFKYEWETKLKSSNWQQIVLGNHSHANMELLDQLGDIDTSALKPGDKKILTISKTDPDEDGNIKTTDYEIAFEDQKALPDVPVDTQGKGLYLTTNKDGEFEWKNSFTPAQTFKNVKFVVGPEFILDEDKPNNPDGLLKKSYKRIILKKDYLTENDILFNPDLHDDILVFDSTGFIQAAQYKLSNAGLLIYIPDDDNHTFDLDEHITLLIIRDGISGIIDTIENQYMTKKEAIELLSSGTIHLNQYVTKKDLEDYAAKIKHHHSEYIRKDDYDIFDFRYADYQHTHSQYITKEQVLGMLIDLTDNDNIDVTSKMLCSKIVDLFNSKLDNIDNKFYSKEQVLAIVSSAIVQASDTNNIKVSVEGPFYGEKLTKYLKHLDDKKIEVDNIYDNKVLLTDVNVELGDDHLGGYSTGDKVLKGTSLAQFLKKLVQKEIAPDIKKPELTFSYTLTNTDVGSESKFIITPHFKQNNGGELKNLKMFIYKSDVKPEENNTEIMLNNDEQFIVPMLMNPYNKFGDCYTVELIAEYNDGPIYKNNLNNGKTYQITNGSIHEYIKIKANRKCYIGSLPFFVNENNLNGDTIHQHVYSSYNNPLIIKDISEKEIENGCKIHFSESSLAKSFIFAIPLDYYTDIKNIFFINQNFSLMDDINISVFNIPDAANGLNDLINNKYKVYYFTLARQIQSDMDFKIYFNPIKKEGEL